MYTVYVWPDGTYCDLGELEEFLSFMSDDYEKVEFETEEEFLKWLDTQY